ncbi:MAG: penicillin-binding protein 1A [Holophagaceae bacterium]|jgi:penicillin-binding protein 1A
MRYHKKIAQLNRKKIQMRVKRYFAPVLLLCSFGLTPPLHIGLSGVDDTQEFLKLFALRTPKTITKVLDRTGNTLGIFSEENRIIIPYGDIPKGFVDALVATEDAAFWTHNGVSVKGLFRAGKNFILSLGTKKQGGSTITMQLVRNVTRKRQKKITRKLQEINLALALEKKYSKQQILEQYANEVYFGGGRYGVESAAQFYFGKSASQMSLEQCALLVGLVQSPERYSKMLLGKSSKDRQFVIDRRNYVLDRMVIEGYIKEAQAAILKKRPIVTARENSAGETIGAYAIEEVRKYLYAKYGKDMVMNGGLEVTTTIDSLWQLAAQEAVQNGIRSVDRRLGYRGQNLKQVKNIMQSHFISWDQYISKGTQVDGVILGWEGDQLKVRIDKTQVAVSRASMDWAGAKVDKVLTRGTVAKFIVTEADGGVPLQIELDQEPSIQAALLAVDPLTGEIRAMVGGYDFNRSKFNRTTQAKRQAGSMLKPFIYGAAFENGLAPNSIVLDVPTRFVSSQEFAIGPVKSDGTFDYKPLYGISKVYEPKNYKFDYAGPLTIWESLAESRNIPAMRTYTQVGPQKVIDFAQRCGIESNLPLLPSLALGSPEVSLAELVRSYSTIANRGLRSPKPFLILKVKDREGKILEEVLPPTAESVVDSQTAFQVIQCMQGVARRGTAAKTNELGWPVAGKTGTTDNYTDGWFVGFSTKVAFGAWVGFDEKKTIFPGADGATVALPIWIEFAKSILPTTLREDFIAPEGMLTVDIDQTTGNLASGLNEKTINGLAFKPGQQPTIKADASSIQSVKRSIAKAGSQKPETILWTPNK